MLEHIKPARIRSNDPLDLTKLKLAHDRRQIQAAIQRALHIPVRIEPRLLTFDNLYILTAIKFFMIPENIRFRRKGCSALLVFHNDRKVRIKE